MVAAPFRTLTLVLGVLTLGTPLAAGPGGQKAPGARSAGVVSDAAARLQAGLPTWLDAAIVPGAQVALVQGGKTAWRGAFGVANADTKVPVTDDSVFEAASLTKPVVAYAVLKLVAAGRLDLDTPLVTWLPGPYDVGESERLKQVTARHVLSHSAGFPNWRAAGRPLSIHFTPGDRFSYSGEGFVYLAAVVERITGETTEAVVRRLVFEPLGMTASSLVWQARYETAKVFGHDLIGAVAGRNTPWRPNAAASLHTTATDYARFVTAVMLGQGLPPALAAEMRRPHTRPDERGINTATLPPSGTPAAGLAWGLGWGLEQDGDGWAVWHWGDNGPAKAFVYGVPRTQTAVVAFFDGHNGLAVVPDLLSAVVGPAPRPSLAWLKIERPSPVFSAFVRTLRNEGAARAIEGYRASRTGGAAAPALSEDLVNTLGYALLRQKKLTDAVAVFEQNVADHPGSWNVYDSLGEALAEAGKVTEAIAAYERSVSLNPANAAGTEALKRLRAKPPR